MFKTHTKLSAVCNVTDEYIASSCRFRTKKQFAKHLREVYNIPGKMTIYNDKTGKASTH